MGIPGSPYTSDFGGPRRDYRDPLLPATGSTERHRRTILVQCCLQLFSLPTVPRRRVSLLAWVLPNEEVTTIPTQEGDFNSTANCIVFSVCAHRTC